jgi:hypothetical protein
MKTARQLSHAERDDIRLRFYREYRGERGCSSVGVRKDKQDGRLYLSVGVAGKGERIPAEYSGLQVRTYDAGPAVHAVHHSVG